MGTKAITAAAAILRAQGQGDAVVTDIEQRARDALNEAGVLPQTASPAVLQAIRRALEAHDATKAEFEAYKREVSEAVKAAISEATMSGEAAKRGPAVWHILSRFILPEPVDPLIEAMQMLGEEYPEKTAERRGRC